MSEERPIETTLRRVAAEKRRETGGMQMHPATRRMLQSEVARCYPGNASGIGWRIWWPRLAMSLGVIVALAWGLQWILKDAPRHGGTGPLAKLERSQEDAAIAELPSSTNAIVATEMVDSTSVAAVKASDAQPVASPEAPRERGLHPTEPPSEPVVTSTTSVAQVPPATEPAPVPRPASSVASTAAPNPTQPSNSTVLAGGRTSFAGLVRQNSQLFQNSIATPDLANTALVAQVMSSFRVEQSGATIRIIDADGSVYSGELQPAVETVATSGRNGAARTKRSSSPNPVSNFSFQAAGMNNSLNRQVLFSGNLAVETPRSGVAPSGRVENRSRSNATTKPVASALLKSRITGQAQVGAGDFIRVEAEAVEPGK